MHIRSTTETDRERFVTTLLSAFASLPGTTGFGSDISWTTGFEMDRGLAAEDDGGAMIATAGAYTFELTLPGGALLPVAGITAVGVLPSHRRRGILTAMMRRQLDDVAARGEAAAVLLASEAVIYRRFGYGPATFMQRLDIRQHRATVQGPPDAGSIRVLPRAECTEVLHTVYDAYRRTQPGAVSRKAELWRAGAGQQPVSLAPHLVAVHYDASGTPDGYAGYLAGPPDRATGNRMLEVNELVALDRDAYTALFRFLCEHDLVTDVAVKSLPREHWLRWSLTDHRAAQVTRDSDWLWVRLLDVPRALAARTYGADGRLVLDVADAFREDVAGRYALTVRDGSAVCERSDDAPDLALDVSDLGSLYLGGTAASALAEAGRVRALSPHALPLADALFRAERTPHTVHWF